MQFHIKNYANKIEKTRLKKIKMISKADQFLYKLLLPPINIARLRIAIVRRT